MIHNRLLAAFLGLFILFTSSGCFELTEIIKLKKDGSGDYEFVMDFSEMLVLIAEMGGDDDDDMPEKMDTLIRFTSLPDSVKAIWSNGEVMEKVSLSMHLDQEKGEGWVSFSYPYNQISDLSSFWSDLGTSLGGDEMMAGTLGDLFGDMNSKSGVPTYSLKGKKLSRSDDQPMSDQMVDEEEGLDDMMRMMFAGSKYTIEYHLPGKVKKISNEEGVEISEDGRVVTQKVSYLDLLDGKVNLGNQIKFK